MASYAVDYERSIISALSVSDPSMDTSLGSPIRKIISAVAVQLADYRVDANTTNTLYAIDAVSGAELDYLVGHPVQHCSQSEENRFDWTRINLHQVNILAVSYLGRQV